jgi:translocation and assembly module TamB
MMRRRTKAALWVVGTLTGLVLLSFIAALIILPSEWFRTKVRDRIVFEVEKATGGEVSIGSFRFDWQLLEAEVAPFELRGTEPADQPPLFRTDSLKVGLKIISVFKRDIDIASLIVERPQVNILVDENGITNFPRPKIERKSDKSPIERLVDLAVRVIELRQGEVHYGDRKLPLDIRGRNLNASLSYNIKEPSYVGNVSFGELQVDSGPILPLTVAMTSKVGLFPNSLRIYESRLSMQDSVVEANGVIEDFKSLRVALDVKATGSLAELGKPLRLPEPHTGAVHFAGKLVYASGEPLRIDGHASGQHLAFRQGNVSVEGISFTSDLHFDPKLISLRGLSMHALEGTFRGMAEIHELKRFKANGEIAGMTVRSLSQLGGMKSAGYGGAVSGPIEVAASLGKGARDLRAGGRVNITPTSDGVPVSGFVEVAYDQRRGSVQLGKSAVKLPSSDLSVTGTLGDSLQVRLETRDLKDLMPAIAMAADNPPESLPLKLLGGGSAVFEGVISGPIQDARAAGNLTLTNFGVRDQRLDRLTATVDATKSGAKISSFALGQDTLRLAGSAQIGLENWRLVDSSAISADVKLENARLAKLIADAGQKLPIEGMLSASAKVSGSAGNPEAVLNLSVDKPRLYGEPFDRIRAEVRYQGVGVEVINGVAEVGKSRVFLAGSYRHPENDWKNGQLRFEMTTRDFTLQQVENINKLQTGLTGQLAIKAAGTINVRNGDPLPELLDAGVVVHDLAFQGRELGNLSIDTKTTGRQLAMIFAGNLRGSTIGGQADVALIGDYPGKGVLEFAPVRLSAVQDLVRSAKGGEPMPVDGVVTGHVEFSGPFRKPEAIRARAELPTVEIVPARRAFTPRQTQELSLRNAQPVVLEYDGKSVHVRSAHMIGRETDLKVSGSAGIEKQVTWDLRLDGNLNLAVLQNFEEDLVSSGAALVNAQVKGNAANPRITGRLEMKDAAFSIIDFPNGIDDANGVILFDDKRATIERLTAKTGGGDLGVAGFVGFGSGELIYRLQASAERVRIRYPEGVSTTANANLSLTGSTAKSLLSGVVTIVRAGFNPQTDVGGLLAASNPIATPTAPNEFLRNMHLDVRVETVPNLQFQTTLTNDIQAEADLRLRGTAAKPGVLGRIVVTQGEIQFFGNKYTINRGEVGFFNPVRIEPVLDLDLETRVRGVLVNITLNGTLRQLNASYRSDPPLQSNEIVALLAVGRAPGTNSSLASTQTVTNTNILASGTNSLLGQAVAAPVSSRLQRFFGVSRLKIDPQLTGVSAVPQARLTVEQQISRDVTLTYITNLAEANQQIVRLEWDISRTWSVVAVREENGLFGIDFFFKKRFR